ncbi:MAG: hypothetical protein QG650_171 [Patescibacteria group bacterium]|nr:hypothetical protein [Patescibacteria group bacterium]
MAGLRIETGFPADKRYEKVAVDGEGRGNRRNETPVPGFERFAFFVNVIASGFADSDFPFLNGNLRSFSSRFRHIFRLRQHHIAKVVLLTNKRHIS